MQLLRATNYRRMPWKNGGGETREIQVSPPGASLESLDWRISLATIASNGPFSAFDGIDRTLCVVRGAGIRLQVGDAPPELLLENSPPYSFAGEAAASSMLVAGATVDLNVMTRRSRFRHTVRRVSIQDHVALRPNANITLVFCQSGNLQCAVDGAAVRMESEDCVILDEQTSTVRLSAAAGTAVLLVIELFEQPALSSL